MGTRFQHNKTPTDPLIDPKNRYTIQNAEVVKDLAIHIDKSLSFKDQEAKAASKAQQQLSALYALRHKERGITFYTARHLFLTLLIPKLLCGSEVWWTGSAYLLNRILVPYHSALRWATGISHYTSTVKLFLIARIPPPK